MAGTRREISVTVRMEALSPLTYTAGSPWPDNTKPVPFPQLPQLRGLLRGDTGPDAVIDIGELQSPVQAGLRDPEVPGDLRQRSLALAGHRDHIPAELQRNAFGMMNILPARTKSSQRSR
jgi:hypothetical protein